MSAHESSPRIDLWIITGFLGSGKTTVLNNLLTTTPEAGRTGVLVNDFGDLAVDASLIPAGTENGRASSVVELSGGQIFCSCLSGAFVDALGDLAERNPDRILVEGSGLAKPKPMADIVAQAARETRGRIRHRGTVCVIDAKRFAALRSVVNAVEEQLYFADIVVVNKIDEVDSASVAAIDAQLRSVNAEAPVLHTTYGRVSLSELAAGAAAAGRQAKSASDTTAAADGRRFAGWNGAGRPVAATYGHAQPLTKRELEAALRRILPGTFRAKGYLAGGDVDWFVSALGEELSIEAVEPDDRDYGLSVIAPADIDIEARLRAAGSTPSVPVAERPGRRP